jgi:hypothetical protein
MISESPLRRRRQSINAETRASVVDADVLGGLTQRLDPSVPVSDSRLPRRTKLAC